LYTERCKCAFFVQATDFVYHQVINDLLDPLGQNLRVREDGQQGTYVEGIKEEVVLSPAHALSLIAAGEGTSTLLQTCICWR
jgi:hypothetical protein